MKRTIWMFAGQGSQYFGMGRNLYESEPVFRQCLQEAEQIFRELTNESLVDILYRARPDRFEPFRRLLHSSPAILAVEYALARVLFDRGLEPDALLGQSLGEITSLVVAGSMAFTDALTLVIKQSAILEYCAPPGGMLAILAPPDLADRHPEAFADCEIAGWNFDRSFLVSGECAALHRLRAFLRQHDVRVFDLPVAHAFHSHWTDIAAASAHELLAGLPLAPPRFAVFSASDGREVLPPQYRDHLWSALRGRMDFPATIRRLEERGPAYYVDLGPSGNLATAIKYILPAQASSSFATIMTPFGQDVRNLQQVLGKSPLGRQRPEQRL